MNNLSSYCRLVDPKIKTSDKDLPVQDTFVCLSKYLVYITLIGTFFYWGSFPFISESTVNNTPRDVYVLERGQTIVTCRVSLFSKRRGRLAYMNRLNSMIVSD